MTKEIKHQICGDGFIQYHPKKEALAQPEQDTCKGCNGNGVVGNILDTDTCPFCKGSGVEAQPEQEPVAIRFSNGVIDVLGSALVPIGTLLYTTPPQRTWVGLTDEDLAVCGDEDDVMLARYWERVCKEKNSA